MDASYRRAERQVESFLKAILDDAPGADETAASQLPEILAIYGRELRRGGACRNKVCVQYRLLADMIRLEAEGSPYVGFGVNRLLSLYRTGLRAPAGAGWHRNERYNIAKAILGGLDRRSTELCLLNFHFGIPVASWSPEGADLNNILDTWDAEGSSDVVIVYRDEGRLVGSRVCSHAERPYRSAYNEPLVWEDEAVIEADMDEEFLARIAEEHAIEDISDVLTHPEGFAQLVWEYCHNHGCQTEANFDKRSFRERFCLELAYESRGWL